MRSASPVISAATATAIRVRAVDWAALSLLAFEVPSLLFSSDRANSVGASEVVALSVLVYFASRLLMRGSSAAAWFAALVGTGGAWLASVGIHQFALRAGQLAAVGLTDMVAFRSRLVSPVPGWVSGEAFTVLLAGGPHPDLGVPYISKRCGREAVFGKGITL